MQCKLASDSICRRIGNSEAGERRQEIVYDFLQPLASHRANLCFMPYEREPSCRFSPPQPWRTITLYLFNIFFICLLMHSVILRA